MRGDHSVLKAILLGVWHIAASSLTRGSAGAAGTAVTLRLGRSLSSADAGDRVDFEVAEEVSVNRIVVIPKDSPGSGTVITAHKKRRMGRAGKLDVSIDGVQLADGERATLRAVKESQGGSHTGIMAGGMVATSLIVWPVAPVFLLLHGKNAECRAHNFDAILVKDSSPPVALRECHESDSRS